MNFPPSASDQSTLMDAKLIEAVLPFGRQQRCERGEHLITTGEQSNCFYYVEQGIFEVSYTAQQTPIVVALIGPGTFFGEIGFFDRLTRTRNIKAIEGAELRRFDQSTLDRIASSDTQLYGKFLNFILRSVCARFRKILADRDPLIAYAAALSTGNEQFKGLQPLPADLQGASGWQQINQQLEDFKARMFDVAYRLQREDGTNIPTDLWSEGEAVLDTLHAIMPQFGDLVQGNKSADLIWGYVFKEVFPYLMRSRFYERAYYKPKGYAGDFYMIELIYRNQPDGDGKLGQLIDGWFLKQVPAKAVRGRRRLLHRTLDRLCQDRLGGDQPIKIMNLACGPSRELFDLLAECDFSDRINALCIDIDPEALQYANQKVNTFAHQATVRFMTENVIKWAMGRIKHDFGPQDIIYTSGLCDYLDSRLVSALIKRCHGQLKPGGVLLIGNFSPTNPDRLFMDHMMYWRLIHRDREELRALFSASPFGGILDILAEEQGVNLFALAQRSH